MEVEHVTGIRLTSGRTAEQQGNLTIRPGMFGEIVINNKGVATGFHELFTDGAARVRCNILKRGRFICGSYNDNCMLHRAVFFKDTQCTGNCGFLLTHSHIDTNYAFAFLIDDGIDRNGGLTGLTVADDQLALSATDRDHGVDGFDTGLNRGIHILAFHHTRGNTFDRAEARGRNRSLAVHRFTQRVHHASDHGIAYWHRCDASQTTNRHTLDNAFVITHNDHTDVVLFKVERNADHAVGKLHQLLCTDLRKTLHTGNTIARFNDRTGIADVEFRLKTIYLFLQITGNLLDQV